MLAIEEIWYLNSLSCRDFYCACLPDLTAFWRPAGKPKDEKRVEKRKRKESNKVIHEHAKYVSFPVFINCCALCEMAWKKRCLLSLVLDTTSCILSQCSCLTTGDRSRGYPLSILGSACVLLGEPAAAYQG